MKTKIVEFLARDFVISCVNALGVYGYFNSISYITNPVAFLIVVRLVIIIAVIALTLLTVIWFDDDREIEKEVLQKLKESNNLSKPYKLWLAITDMTNYPLLVVLLINGHFFLSSCIILFLISKSFVNSLGEKI